MQTETRSKRQGTFIHPIESISRFSFPQNATAKNAFPYLPEFSTDLVSALSSLNMNDFTHGCLIIQNEAKIGFSIFCEKFENGLVKM